MKNFSKFALSIFAVFSFTFLMFSSDDEEKKEPNKNIIKAKTEQEFYEWYTNNWVGKPISDFTKKFSEASNQYFEDPSWEDLVEIPGAAGGTYIYDMRVHILTPENTCGRVTLCCEYKKD